MTNEIYNYWFNILENFNNNKIKYNEILKRNFLHLLPILNSAIGLINPEFIAVFLIGQKKMI